MICEKCKKEIEVEHDDPHYPDGKNLGIYGFSPLDIWLCYDCNKEYMGMFKQHETDYEWEKLKGFLEKG